MTARKSKWSWLSQNQVELFGTARRSEIESGRVVKSARIGTGRAYVGTHSARRPSDSEPAALPLLRLGSFRPLDAVCR